MNHKHILDLTLRLSQALDQNYDVVSMETVLSVITALEGATITKEQLEATRLAKYINQLRRRTKSENLARRAKSLLKKWREMVGIQQTNESTSTPLGGSSVGIAASASTTSMLTTTAASNIPVTDNVVSTSNLITVPHFRTHHSDTHFQHQHLAQHQNSIKQQHQQQHPPCHSQPTSPLSYMDKPNQNDFLNSTMSNPASVSLFNKGGSNLAVRKKKRLEKLAYDQQQEQQQPAQQQPTSFANLLTGLGSSSNSFSSLRKSRDIKCSSSSTIVKPHMETFIIEHSSNSNPDLICMPSNTVSAFTSSKNVPPIVIDLQDTNSSMNSLVSKDVNNASLTFSSLTTATKRSSKKSKKDKKRRERDIVHPNQPLHDCDDNNTATNISYHHLQRPPDKLLMEEKSHSACPTISNISEILSLSNSSMSSVFPSTDVTSKNIYDSGQNEFASSLKMSKSDLTFAGKFKQNTSSTTSAMCDVLSYNSDSVSGVNISSSQRSASPNNRNKFTPFSGIDTVTNSSDSTSSSHVSHFNVVVDSSKKEASNYVKQNTEELQLKHYSNDKSLSNMSNKGNCSIDNVFAVAATSSAISSQQQLQSIDLTTIDLSSEQTIKQPKKRGRKKGSKGVDSVIAKETSLSSQMLISSLTAGGKKVKTTKELFAEMQNRKLHSTSNIVGSGGGDVSTQSTSINWPLQQQQKTLILQRVSSCSDLAESDSCTMTSEPSRDSANPSKMGKSETPLDSNSNYSQFDTDIKILDVQQEDGITPAAPNSSTIALTTANVKNQLNQILKLLSPPPTIKDLELESLVDSMPCSCSIIEILPKFENSNDSSNDEQVNNAHTEDHNSFSYATIKNETVTEENKLNENTKNVLNVTTSIANIQKNTVQPPPPKILKKSIFDLDFDDDEDPLNSIIADIVGKNSKENDLNAVKSVKVYDDSVTNVNNLINSKDDPTRDDQQQMQSSLNLNMILNPPPPVSSDIQIVFPTYEVKLDPDCKAKQRFDIQTQKITKFHIDALHNCFIPNINGNWNHAEYVTNENVSLNNSNDNKQIIIDGYGVVPFYGTEIKEHIRKDLSHVKFTRKTKSKSSLEKKEIFNNIPFMGVSRILKDSTESSCRNKKLKEPKRYREYYEQKEENTVLKCNQEDNRNIAQVEGRKQNEKHEVFNDLYNKTTEPSNIKNNNVILTKISIDIKSNEIGYEESTVLTTNDNITPLLAIADVNNFAKTEIEPKIVIYGNEEKDELMEKELQESSHNDGNCRRNSSGSSNNSLKQSQQSINLKLKQQRQEKQQEQKLESKNAKKLKRRKSTTHPLIKRLKIHINGNIESISSNQQFPNEDEEHHSNENISDSEESDFREKANDNDEDNRYAYCEDEEDEENKYNDDVYDGDGVGEYHHEVVTHDIPDSSASGRKHIVLTIKKTPSKTNSPINFLPNLSPSSSSPLKNINTNVNSLENNNCNQQIDNQNHLNVRNDNIQDHIKEEKARLKCFKKRLQHNRQISQKKLKLHNLLFFPDELCPLIRDHSGQEHECIFNTSSCSSSTCTDNEEYDELETVKEEKISCQNNFHENNEALSSQKVSIPLSSRLSETNVENSQKVDDNDDSRMDENIENVITDDSDDENDLPEENNLMLLTFNNIYCKNFKKDNHLKTENGQHQQEQQQKQDNENVLKQQLQNCDDYNNLYNNSNLNLMKYIDNKSSFVNNNIINSCSNNYPQHNNNSLSSSSRSRGNCNSLIIQNENGGEDENIISNHMEPYKEYHTGIRAVDEDVDDAQGNNCARLQQFKEWHEVLQLRSYNDELLPVLPYVVLE